MKQKKVVEPKNKLCLKVSMIFVVVIFLGSTSLIFGQAKQTWTKQAIRKDINVIRISFNSYLNSLDTVINTNVTRGKAKRILTIARNRFKSFIDRQNRKYSKFYISAPPYSDILHQASTSSPDSLIVGNNPNAPLSQELINDLMKVYGLLDRDLNEIEKYK